MIKQEKHRKLLDKLHETYISKNADYGDSFGQSIRKYGNIAGLTRISDKFNRIENLILNGNMQVTDEALEDSLLDLSNYCVMLVMELNNEPIDN